jgi:hypothetical protein
MSSFKTWYGGAILRFQKWFVVKLNFDVNILAYLAWQLFWLLLKN